MAHHLTALSFFFLQPIIILRSVQQRSVTSNTPRDNNKNQQQSACSRPSPTQLPTSSHPHLSKSHGENIPHTGCTHTYGEGNSPSISIPTHEPIDQTRRVHDQLKRKYKSRGTGHPRRQKEQQNPYSTRYSADLRQKFATKRRKIPLALSPNFLHHFLSSMDRGLDLLRPRILFRAHSGTNVCNHTNQRMSVEGVGRVGSCISESYSGTCHCSQCIYIEYAAYILELPCVYRIVNAITSPSNGLI